LSDDGGESWRVTTIGLKKEAVDALDAAQHPIVAAPKQNAAIFEQDKQQILILGWIKTWRTCDDSIQCRADVPVHPTFSVTSSDNRACCPPARLRATVLAAEKPNPTDARG
jgi:hypothetical protein